MFAGDTEWMLSVERSTRRGSVALYRGAEQAVFLQAPADPCERTDLCSLFDQALDAAGLRPDALRRLGVGVGPGSFSGIRSAIGFLQGLAMPSRLTLEAVSSAAVLAWTAFRETPEAQRMAVVGDARRGELWCALYARQPPTLREEIPLHLLPPDRIREALPCGVPVLTPDADRLGEWLQRMVGKAFRQGEWHPGADALAELLRDPGAPRAPAAVPIYLHPAVAGGPLTPEVVERLPDGGVHTGERTLPGSRRSPGSLPGGRPAFFP